MCAAKHRDSRCHLDFAPIMNAPQRDCKECNRDKTGPKCVSGRRAGNCASCRALIRDSDEWHQPDKRGRMANVNEAGAHCRARPSSQIRAARGRASS